MVVNSRVRNEFRNWNRDENQLGSISIKNNKCDMLNLEKSAHNYLISFECKIQEKFVIFLFLISLIVTGSQLEMIVKKRNGGWAFKLPLRLQIERKETIFLLFFFS